MCISISISISISMLGDAVKDHLIAGKPHDIFLRFSMHGAQSTLKAPLTLLLPSTTSLCCSSRINCMIEPTVEYKAPYAVVTIPDMYAADVLLMSDVFSQAQETMKKQNTGGMHSHYRTEQKHLCGPPGSMFGGSLHGSLSPQYNRIE